jgi:lysophospholipase L1-like esterase
MIDTFLTMTSTPDIYLCLPAPSHIDNWGINDSTIVAGVIPLVKEISERNNLTSIDLYEALSAYPEYFPDGIHPDEEGARIMAEVICEVINK